jgi:hypothetical protein
METIHSLAYIEAVMSRLGMEKDDIADLLGVHIKTVEAWLGERRPIPIYAGTCLWLLDRICAMEAFYEGVEHTKH